MKFTIQTMIGRQLLKMRKSTRNVSKDSSRKLWRQFSLKAFLKRFSLKITYLRRMTSKKRMLILLSNSKATNRSKKKSMMVRLTSLNKCKLTRFLIRRKTSSNKFKPAMMEISSIRELFYQPETQPRLMLYKSNPQRVLCHQW